MDVDNMRKLHSLLHCFHLLIPVEFFTKKPWKPSASLLGPMEVLASAITRWFHHPFRAIHHHSRSFWEDSCFFTSLFGVENGNPNILAFFNKQRIMKISYTLLEFSSSPNVGTRGYVKSKSDVIHAWCPWNVFAPFATWGTPDVY